MGCSYSVPCCIDAAAPHVLLRTSPGVRAQGIQFSVVITEGRPDETGLTMAQALDNMRVPTIAILDSAVAYALEAFRCALPAQAGQSRTSVGFTVFGMQKMGYSIRAAPVCCIQQRASVREEK